MVQDLDTEVGREKLNGNKNYILMEVSEMKIKNARDICWYFAMFFTGMFLTKAFSADYLKGCIVAGIAIGLFIASYILARCSSKE